MAGLVLVRLAGGRSRAPRAACRRATVSRRRGPLRRLWLRWRYRLTRQEKAALRETMNLPRVIDHAPYLGERP